MADAAKVHQYVELLRDEAQLFGALPCPERAYNLLYLCEHIEAAVTGYLIQAKVEGINGSR